MLLLYSQTERLKRPKDYRINLVVHESQAKKEGVPYLRIITIPGTTLKLQYTFEPVEPTRSKMNI